MGIWCHIVSTFTWKTTFGTLHNWIDAQTKHSSSIKNGSTQTIIECRIKRVDSSMSWCQSMYKTYFPRNEKLSLYKKNYRIKKSIHVASWSEIHPFTSNTSIIIKYSKRSYCVFKNTWQLPIRSSCSKLKFRIKSLWNKEYLWRFETTKHNSKNRKTRQIKYQTC